MKNDTRIFWEEKWKVKNKMKKKMFWWLVSLVVIVSTGFLVKSAMAIEEGQNLTQNQIDNFNVENIDKTFLNCRVETRFRKEPSYIYSCLDFEQRELDRYEVVRSEHIKMWNGFDFFFRLLEYFGNQEDTKNWVQGSIDRDIDETILGIKDRVLTYKTGRGEELIRRWLRNYNPF